MDIEKWSTNSGCHEEDQWIFSDESVNGVKVRQREFDLYFSDRTDLDIVDTNKSYVQIKNISYDESVALYSSCYNVEEWISCPYLLNNFRRIDIDPESINQIKNGSTNTKMHTDLSNATGDLTKWFVRTSASSPKDNISMDKMCEQAKPFDNVHQTLYAIATSDRCNIPMKYGFNNYLWIAPWIDLSSYISYRVFIRDNKVRAISQYDQENPPSNPLLVQTLVKKLWLNVQEHVWYTDCTMDVLIENLPTNSGLASDVKIIEFNEFGASSKAGSALYNWIQDMHILYFGDADIRLNEPDFI